MKNFSGNCITKASENLLKKHTTKDQCLIFFFLFSSLF